MRQTMTSAALAVLIGLGFSTTASAAGGKPVVMVCRGPLATKGHAIVARDKLPIGADAAACFGQGDIYHMPAKELFAAEPASACHGRKAIDAYSRSMAGGWFALFPAPVCGSRIRLGPPRNGRGIATIVIDGRRYGGDAGGDFRPLR
jgi:hypothetical protein